MLKFKFDQNRLSGWAYQDYRDINLGSCITLANGLYSPVGLLPYRRDVEDFIKFERHLRGWPLCIRETVVDGRRIGARCHCSSYSFGRTLLDFYTIGTLLDYIRQLVPTTRERATHVGTRSIIICSLCFI